MKDTTIHTCFPFSHILHTTSFHLLPSLSTSSHLIHFPSSPTSLYIHFHLPTVLTPASFSIILFTLHTFLTHQTSFSTPIFPHLPSFSSLSSPTFPCLLCLLSHLPNTFYSYIPCPTPFSLLTNLLTPFCLPHLSRHTSILLSHLLFSHTMPTFSHHSFYFIILSLPLITSLSNSTLLSFLPTPCPLSFLPCPPTPPSLLTQN